MAIDLFCYTVYQNDELEGMVRQLITLMDDLYQEKFIVSKIMPADEMSREMAKDFGLVARSYFLIRVNDKSAVNQIPEVSLMVKSVVGANNVIVLWEGEKLI